MYDNKVRLSPDVIQKAEAIAQEWGLKNARAAVEAVFRRYADEFLQPTMPAPRMVPANGISDRRPAYTAEAPQSCEALAALDELLGL
ncbi:MAG TPA: hypothetical protein IGS53_10655 [Leptolyngbyaceae cyanobacterium M33_DOE_097]|uniref:Uncharacterized protein n=1 Tax=Oscillatoriales cyanobacterium SpSt-418 TaxID=2282169 RepID=A0A7C3PJ76_9CYAN|nr:hypothetical protein [Leptolyngbyaceae cyanobacterium M33_DOE_097]